MTSRMNYFAGVILAATAVSCASKPPQYQNLSSSSSPSVEIDRTEEMLKDAHARQVDILSPKNYADARKALDKAKDKKDKGRSNDDILEQVAYSRGWLNEANAKSEIAETSMKDITDARAGAIRAGAPEIFPDDWKKADRDLTNATSSLEKGSLGAIEKKGGDLVSRYRELEVMSVSRDQLGAAQENIREAKKYGADKKAPRTYNLAIMKFENADKMIKSDPRNSVAIQRASEDATRESLRLLDITRKVNAGNSEDLVLMAERQQRTIATLRKEYSSTEKELAQSQKQLSDAERAQMELEKARALNQAAEKMRSQFKPNEAEVFTEGGKLMVRLRGLQFPSNKATLGPKNQALLKKVETALNEVEPAKITIEGHSDATGNPDKNTVLSEQRAQAVEKFFVSSGTLANEQVEAVGLGSDSPISDNATARGRAENRRIDLIIEPESAPATKRE